MDRGAVSEGRRRSARLPGESRPAAAVPTSGDDNPGHATPISSGSRTGAEPKPDPSRGLTRRAALLVEYEPDRYETTSAYALFHFQM